MESERERRKDAAIADESHIDSCTVIHTTLMPAVKVKKRSSMDCVGENLCSCQKYCKTSKRSCLQVKTSQQEAILLDSTQDSIEVPSNIGRSDLVVDRTEANNYHDIFSGASTQLPKLPTLPSCDPMSEGRTTTIPAEPQCILETIFSPILKPDDGEFKSINQTIPVREVENGELPLLVADDSDDGSCSSSELQICNVSDFYICENANSLTFDGDLAFTDIMNATCAEYEPMNTEMMLETSERYMILPFLEKTLETSSINEVDYTEESVMNTDDAFLYLAIHQIKSSDQETEMTYHPHHLSETECFDPQLIFRNLPDLPEAVSSFRPLLLPKENRKRKSITLVLDLDETLVHSTLEHCEDADFSFPVFFNMKEHMVYVKRRPYLQMFLETVAGMFEIVIFTASQSIYAEQLLDILDPDKKLIGQRIYRESCIFSDGSYTKDLTVLGVDLAKVAIIDNSPQVFRLQVNNGIPIESWFDDPADNALISLLPFLETLADAEDVRPLIAKRFGNKE